MYQYSNSLIRQFPSLVTGNAAVGVQATVYVGETNTLAQLFEVGGLAKSNPVTTDSKGFYSFSLADGDYRIVFSSSQFAALRISVLDGAQIREEFDDLVASNTAFRNEQQAAYDAFVLSQGWDQIGTFAVGFTFTSPNQVGQDDDGNWWRWNGAFNKVVTAGTLPSSDANYKLVGDGVLRSDLAAVDSTVPVGGVEAGTLPKKSLASAVQLDIPAGRILTVSDRDNYDFMVTTGLTPNGYDIIQMDSGKQLQIIPKNGQVSLKSLGAAEDAKGDGVELGTTDDTAVVQRVCTLGLRVLVKNKFMVSASSVVFSNTQFTGMLNSKVSQLVIKPGVEVNNPFEVVDASNVRFFRLGFIGNSIASVSSQAGAIRFRAVSSGMSDLAVEQCYFENFKHNYWVYCRNDGAEEISKIYVNDNRFISKIGNDINPNSLGVPACCIAFQGSTTNKTGIVTSIQANDNFMNCEYMKAGIFVWSNCKGGEIARNDIRDCGKFGFDDRINYAIALYTNRYLFGATDYDYDPSGFDIHHNIIPRPRDVGVYMQGLVESQVYHNQIYGQTSTADASLLKGALVTNGVHAVDIYSNVMWGNVFDIALAQINYKPDRAIICTARNNECLSKTAQAVKIVPNAKFVVGETQSGLKSTVNLIDNTIRGSIQYRVSSVADNFELNVKGGSIKESPSNIGFFLFNSSTPTPAAGLWINLTDIDFADLGQDGVNITVGYTTTVIDRCKFDMSTIKNKGLALQNSRGVTWINNYFWASGAVDTGDHCVNVTSAEYFSYGNTTRGIPTANKAIGFVTPAWAAQDGDKVQRLDLVEVGTTPDKYIVSEYAYLGSVSAWREIRQYTGA